jgi:hypothetical protein
MPRSHLVLLALAFSLVVLPNEGRALNQPRGGPRIPVGNALQMLFDAQRETLRAQDDAAVTPERFVPGCTLTFTLISRGDAAFRNIFGWYNVRPGMPPDPNDLHPLIPCDAANGARFTLNLRDNPDYRGGEIGFFLKTPEDGTSGRCTQCCARIGPGAPGHAFFSERRYNPDSMGEDSYIHLLIYDSRTTPNAFYFAWEDLYSGGDNNFTDFVARVDSIVCTGAGAPCDTGRPGACGLGIRQCRGGELTCVGTTTPSAERCDGVDNDCNGRVDDGDGLCGAMRVCDRGVCVDRCRVELGCFPGEVCTERGTCVPSACAMVACEANQRCEGGRCVGACEGITCPRGQVCRVGRCVDPCAGVTCDSDAVCVDGVCVPRCECRRCATGETCGRDGRCRPNDCATVTCPAGQSCVGGMCRDACMGAVCPRGERCVMGACVPIPPPMPMDAAVAPDGAALPDVAPPPDVEKAPPDGGAMDAGADADRFVSEEGPGCGCRVGGLEGSHAPRGVVGCLLFGVGLRRRRRRG